MALNDDIRTGRKTFGSYRVVRELGSGGMGVVFECEHTVMGRRAAVKVLRRDLAANEQAIQRLFTEARATSEVRHPGIVQIFDCGITEGTPWLVMELLQGETLAARIGRTGPLGERQVVVMAQQIVSALAAAHAAGIIHRDLKPDNLFIVPDPDVTGGERVKILDFGIAKVAPSVGGPNMQQTRTGVMMGTPLYMSPEQCRGNRTLDARSDIYSLGIIVYQLLAGAPPFVSDGLGELLTMQMLDPAPPIEAHVPGIDPALARVVATMLEKEPANRFQTMTELQRSLATCANAASSGARSRTTTPLPGAARLVATAPPKTPAPPPARTPGGTAPRATTPLPDVRPGLTTPMQAAAASTTLSYGTAEMDADLKPRRSRAGWYAVGVVAVAGAAAAAFLFGPQLRGTDVTRLTAKGPSTEGATANPTTANPTTKEATTTGPATAGTTAPSTDVTPAVAPPATPEAEPKIAAPAGATAAATAPGTAAGTTRGGNQAVADVTWDILSTPSEAHVVSAGDGKVLGVTPLHLARARAAGVEKVRIEKKGFRSRTLSVPRDRDFDASLKLDATAPPPPAPPAPPSGERIIKL